MIGRQSGGDSQKARRWDRQATIREERHSQELEIGRQSEGRRDRDRRRGLGGNQERKETRTGVGDRQIVRRGIGR